MRVKPVISARGDRETGYRGGHLWDCCSRCERECAVGQGGEDPKAGLAIACGPRRWP